MGSQAWSLGTRGKLDEASGRCDPCHRPNPTKSYNMATPPSNPIGKRGLTQSPQMRNVEQFPLRLCAFALGMLLILSFQRSCVTGIKLSRSW